MDCQWTRTSIFHWPLFTSECQFFLRYSKLPIPCFFPYLNYPLQTQDGVFKIPFPSKIPFLKSPSQLKFDKKCLQLPFPSGAPFFIYPSYINSFVVILPSIKYPSTHYPSAIVSFDQSLHFPLAYPLLNSPLSTPSDETSTPIPSGRSSLDCPQQTVPSERRQVPNLTGLPACSSPLQQFAVGSRYQDVLSLRRGDSGSSLRSSVFTESVSFFETISEGTTMWFSTYFDSTSAGFSALILRVEGVSELISHSTILFSLALSDQFGEPFISFR